MCYPMQLPISNSFVVKECNSWLASDSLWVEHVKTWFFITYLSWKDQTAINKIQKAITCQVSSAEKEVFEVYRYHKCDTLTVVELLLHLIIFLALSVFWNPSAVPFYLLHSVDDVLLSWLLKYKYYKLQNCLYSSASLNWQFWLLVIKCLQ